MPTGTPEEVRSKLSAQGEYNAKMANRKLNASNMKKSGYAPDSVKFLANEMIALGPQFVWDTLDQQCIKMQGTKIVTVDINSLIMVLRMLGFQTSTAE